MCWYRESWEMILLFSADGINSQFTLGKWNGDEITRSTIIGLSQDKNANHDSTSKKWGWSIKHLRYFLTHVNKQTNDAMRWNESHKSALSAILVCTGNFLHSANTVEMRHFKSVRLTFVSDSYCAGFVTCAIYSDYF